MDSHIEDGNISDDGGVSGLTTAHQPPASCAKSDEPRVATTSPLHRWPDAITGKSTLPRDAPQAPDPSERGAVAGRLHALVGRLYDRDDLPAICRA